jgi:integrase
VAAYLAGYRDAYAATHEEASTRLLDRFVRFFGGFCAKKGVTTVQGVNRAVCRDYLEWRAKTCSHNALKTERGYLMPVWSRAEADGLIEANPWRHAKPPGRPTKKAPTFWRPEEIARIADACARPLYRDLVIVLAETGLRISACLAMEWGWVDFERGAITLPVEESKGDKEISIPLRPAARAALERRRRSASGDGPLVFPSPRKSEKPIHYDTAAAAIERAVAKAGVRPGTAHDLRHSFARNLILSGAPINVVKSLLGHSSIVTTQTYSDLTDEDAARFMRDSGLDGS